MFVVVSYLFVVVSYLVCAGRLYMYINVCSSIIPGLGWQTVYVHTALQASGATCVQCLLNLCLSVVEEMFHQTQSVETRRHDEYVTTHNHSHIHFVVSPGSSYDQTGLVIAKTE